MTTSFWTRLFDLISPRTCGICGSRLTVNERLLCAPCHVHLPLTHYEQSPLDNPLARLFWGHFSIERAAAWFFYEPQSATSSMFYDLKYNGMPEVGESLGFIAARHMADAGFFDGIDAIVPMPITRLRRWKRGYNQSKAIAKGVKEYTSIPILDNVVKRTQFKQSQTTESAWGRMRNVEEAFRLTSPEKIANKHILLIDDIITTGATVTACGRELDKAEGVRVSVMAIGRTKS